MNQAQYEHLLHRLFANLNRISKLSKYIKDDIHTINNDDSTEQETDMAHANFESKIYQIEMLLLEVKLNYKKLTENDVNA